MYLTVIQNNAKPRVFIVPIHSADQDEIERVAAEHGIDDLDDVEWMAGKMDIDLHI